jgi:hypothetical protein
MKPIRTKSKLRKLYFFKLKDFRRLYLIMLMFTVQIWLSQRYFAIDLDDGIPIDSDIPHSE